MPFDFRAFDPASAEKLYRVPYATRAAEAASFAAAEGLRPAAEDRVRVGLLAVDVQNTFCLPEFELFVAGRSGRGAIEDNARLCTFVYRNLSRISEIVVTLDTHTAFQIFHPVFWVDARGEHPPANTIVSASDVERGVWRINPRLASFVASPGFDLDAYARHYARTLESGGKYPLYLWPYHAMLGGVGHALVSAVEEAFFFHSIARTSPTRFEVKGRHALTENYSVLRPEVLTDHTGRPVAEENRALVENLLGYDALVVAGQAKSHCVAWTVADLLTVIEARDRSLARRVYLLEDCTSAVVVPGVVDFTERAETAFARFETAGMHRVRSTDPMESWPGFTSFLE
jgi:nicotinamidase-related amidase